MESRTGERRSQTHSPETHRGWYSRGYLPHFDSPDVLQHITYRLADSLPRAVLEQMQAEVEALVQEDEKRKTEMRRRIETYLDAGHGSCVLREPAAAACVLDTWHRFDGERYHLLEWVVMPNHCHVLIEPFEGASLGKIVLSWKNYTARFINEYKSRTGVRRSQESRTGVRRSQESRTGAWQSEESRTGEPWERRTPVRQEEGDECRSGERRSQGQQSQGRHFQRRPSQGGQSQVWQRDYWDRYVRDEPHFEAVKGYIRMNPVKAGLVAKPEDWPWCSAKARWKNDGAR